MAPQLSIIIPSYRSAAIATRSVTELVAYLDKVTPATWEIILVDDGGRDFDAELRPKDDRVRLLRLAVNQGKGAAVRAGMTAATGRARIFTDVDLPYGVELIPLIADLLLRRGFHLVIGDRTLPGSYYNEEQRNGRRMASAISAFFVGRLLTGGFFDTQCGLKGIRGDVADHLFPMLHVDRFAFDAELIYAALKHRLDIKRIPVQLLNNQTSSVRVWRDLAVGALDILRIKARQLRGHYHSVALEHLTEAEFQASRRALSSAALEGAE